MVKTEWHGDRKKREMSNAMQRTIIRSGNIVEASQKLLTPVDTGNLRSSIEQSFPDKLTVDIGTNVEYAPYVELGTSRQSAQPFIKPSLFSNADKIKQIAITEGSRVAK